MISLVSSGYRRRWRPYPLDTDAVGVLLVSFSITKKEGLIMLLTLLIRKKEGYIPLTKGIVPFVPFCPAFKTPFYISPS